MKSHFWKTVFACKLVYVQNLMLKLKLNNFNSIFSIKDWIAVKFCDDS